MGRTAAQSKALCSTVIRPELCLGTSYAHLCESTKTMSTTTTQTEPAGEALFEKSKSSAHQRHDSGHASQATWNLDDGGRFRAFPWDVSTLMLPQHIGKATTSVSLQKATKIKYLAIVIIGLAMFYLSSSATIRTAGLSMLFPGAGFLAVGGIAGTIGFLSGNCLLAGGAVRMVRRWRSRLPARRLDHIGCCCHLARWLYCCGVVPHHVGSGSACSGMDISLLPGLSTKNKRSPQSASGVTGR